MSWRGESWSEIVARASTSSRRVRPIVEREDPAALAARAQPWTFQQPAVALSPSGLVIGTFMESVEVAFAQLYHVEPVDPWPSIAIGWVEGGASHSCALTPTDEDAAAFAAQIEAVVEACTEHVPRATVRGWLDVSEEPWERVEHMPGEVDEGPEMRGYREAPEVPDPVVAKRTLATGGPRLWTFVLARVRRPPRRIEPRQIVLTRAFVYARTRDGLTLRIPVSTLRTARRTTEGDAIYVFGRNTELLLVHQEGDELAAHLDARL